MSSENKMIVAEQSLNMLLKSKMLGVERMSKIYELKKWLLQTN